MWADTADMIDVREATADDAMAVAQAHVRSWQAGYRGLIDQEFLDALRPEDRASNYGFAVMNSDGRHTIVALDQGIICGHITTGRSRDQDLPNSGEIWALYVDPSRWGKGVGSALMTAGCNELRRSGYQQGHLWVISGNSRARRFYEREGWRTDGIDRADVIGASSVHEVRYRISLGGSGD